MPSLQTLGLGLNAIGTGASIYGNYRQRKAMEKENARRAKLAQEENEINKMLLRRTMEQEDTGQAMNAGSYANNMLQQLLQRSQNARMGT
jgi:hypothetical protein